MFILNNMDFYYLFQLIRLVLKINLKQKPKNKIMPAYARSENALASKVIEEILFLLCLIKSDT